jgi:hypothetical protein
MSLISCSCYGVFLFMPAECLYFAFYKLVLFYNFDQNHELFYLTFYKIIKLLKLIILNFDLFFILVL